MDDKIKIKSIYDTDFYPTATSRYEHVIFDLIDELTKHDRASGNFAEPNLLYLPAIKNVIFNKPATIVFWKDGSKTVVKCDKEKYDPEKGLAMAIAKKALGNKGNYYEVIKKWVGEERLFGKKKAEESEKKTVKKVEKKNKK